MSVNLQKGQKVDLTKGNASLKRIIVGLGWDEVDVKRGLFSGPKQAIDCDASAIICGSDGKLINKNLSSNHPLNPEVIYFGNLKHSSQCVVHKGDNLTGQGDGDDEQIVVQLADLPQQFEHITFVVNIYQAAARKQHFGLIRNAFIRIVDADKNQELCRYNLTDDYSNMTAMIFGEIYRHQGEWKFNALGQGTTDDSLVHMTKRYL